MARSHVKEELARARRSTSPRSSWTPTAICRSPTGPPCSTCPSLLRAAWSGVWSRAVDGLAVTKPVLREVNDANAWLVLSRTWVQGNGVMVEGCLPVETMRSEDLRALCSEVGTTADRLGSMLSAVHGGQVTLPVGAGLPPAEE